MDFWIHIGTNFEVIHLDFIHIQQHKHFTKLTTNINKSFLNSGKLNKISRA